MTHDHAFVTLRVNGAPIDIETTNQYGFDPGRQKEFLDAFGNVTGYSYVDPQSYSDRTPISQVEMVSLILTNRISSLQTQKRFNDTLPLMANRAELLSMRPEKTTSPFFTDPVKDLKENLLASAGVLFNAGKYADVLQFAALANSRYPDPEWQELAYACLKNSILETLKQNNFGGARNFLNANGSLVSSDNYKTLDTLIYGMLNNSVATALNRNRFDEARNILNSNAASISRENYDEINAMICDVELAHLVSNIRNSADGEKALALLSDPHTASLLSADRVAQLRSVAINNQAIYLSQEKGLHAAIQFAEDALKWYGKNANLEKNLEVFRANRVTELHNTFADLWNKGKYNDARAYLSDALREFPDNPTFTNDWNKIKDLK
jgi:tetratricopeptide (TPR) repeat protein